jgi:hypothetical protein
LVVANTKQPQTNEPSPMAKLPFPTWICNAAAVFSGLFGRVSQQAQQADCSRQTVYDHAHKVQRAVQECFGDAVPDEPLQARIRELQQELQQLYDYADTLIDFPRCRQQRFAATASAMGLSTTQIADLLAIVLPRRQAPSRSVIDRWLQAAQRAATSVLKVLDRACHSLLTTVALDEIFFHGKPVLMGVCPQSMAWVLGRRSADRSGKTWSEALRGFESVTRVLSDGGTGLAKGIAGLQQRQQQAQQPLCSAGLDVFHLKREGKRALRWGWSKAEALWKQADQADRRWQQKCRRTGDNRGVASASAKAWKKALASYHAAEGMEQAWKRIEAALEWFRPDGQLNDRTWANQEIAAALVGLSGSEWAKVKRALHDPRSLSFLEDVQARLTAAVPDAALREALVERWRLRHRESRDTSLGVVKEIVQTELCRKLDARWEVAYARVRSVLGQAVRASSAVECVNSVVRMQQARQRNVSQGMLDLKRLWWNTRRFGAGKRKGASPLQLLGLKGEGLDFWSLVHANPAQLASQLGLPAQPENLSSS